MAAVKYWRKPNLKIRCVICKKEISNPKFGIMTCEKKNCEKEYKIFIKMKGGII